MVERTCCWSVLTLVSVIACVLTGGRVAETRRQIGLLRRDVGLATLEEEALQHHLAQERNARAVGLLAPLRRPITPELPTIFQRVPADVRVSAITVTPEEWQITGQRLTPTDDGSLPPYELHIRRAEAARSG